MTILNNKALLIAIIVIAIVGVVLIVCMSKKQSAENEANLEAYEEYLLSLSPEDVIIEHFKNKNEKEILKIKATVVDRYKEIDWTQRYLKQIEVLGIIYNSAETENYIKIVNDDKTGRFFTQDNNSFPERKVYDVTYKVEYKRSAPKDDGVYTWRYYMLKKSNEDPWLIEEFGF